MSPPPKLPEFIFGPLSTAEGRARQARRDRLGFDHPVGRLVLAPDAGEDVVIRARVGTDLAVVAMELRYTTNPSLPLTEGTADGAHPVPGVFAVVMTRTRLDWDTLAWGHLEEWSAPIPGQLAGTTLYYAI
ncbi:MAG: alpha-amylase, partial [Cyanobacteriota bacterium]